jgi:hypothetical protein
MIGRAFGLLAARGVVIKLGRGATLDTASSYGAADLEFDQRRPPASKTDTTTNLCDD